MKKILIVDDEESIIRMYADVLADNYGILTARNGTDAIVQAKEYKPDLIYLDIIMPKLNGLDVLKQLKNDPETKNIPIVLLTNLPKEASGDKAAALGASEYFVKVENDPDRIAEFTKNMIGK